MLMSLALILPAGTAYSGDVEKGKSLFNAATLGTNGKSCNTCHLGGKDIDGSKKTFNVLGEQLNSIGDTVNYCIENALEGKPLDGNSEGMKNIISYVKTLKPKKIQEHITPGY